MMSSNSKLANFSDRSRVYHKQEKIKQMTQSSPTLNTKMYASKLEKNLSLVESIEEPTLSHQGSSDQPTAQMVNTSGYSIKSKYFQSELHPASQ